MSRRRVASGLSVHGLTLAGFAALTAILCWPVLRSPASVTFPSLTRDNFADFWNLWWVHRALDTGQDVFRTSLLYFPHGTTLVFTEFGPLYGFLSAPLLALRPAASTPVLAHNLWIMATFILTGYTVFLFARRESGETPGAMIAAVSVAFAAFRFHHLETLNLLSAYWVPLTAHLAGIWCLKPPGNAADSGMPRAWCLPGLGLCGLGLSATSFFYLTSAALLVGFWFIGVVLFDRDRFRPGVRWRPLTAAGAAAIGALPILLRWWAEVRRDGLPAPVESELARWGLDLAGLVLPQGSWALGGLVRAAGENLHGPGGREVYLGLVFATLWIIGAARFGRVSRPLLLAAASLFLLSLGGLFWIGGHRVDLPVGPYRLLTTLIPPVGANRTPERFLMTLLIALAPAAARGAGRLGRIHPALIPGVFLLALVELVPRPLNPDPIPDFRFCEAIRSNPDTGAVIELSLDNHVFNDFMFYQTIHGRPMVGGVLARPSRGAVAFQIETKPFERLSYPASTEAAIRDLRSAGVAFVVWHRWAGMEDATWSTLTSAFRRYGEAIYQDDRTAAFHITP